MRYAWLKMLRDRSVALALLPSFGVASLVIGASIAQGARYPFYIDAHGSPASNAYTAATFGILYGVMTAGIAAFWTFRPEIATHSIALFVLAVRPVEVITALVIYTAALMVAGWVLVAGVVVVLIAVVPPHAGILLALAIASAIAASSAGALLATISTQPMNVLWTFFTFAIVAPFIEKPGPHLASRAATAIAIALAFSLVCVTVSTFLLERRCAT
jgi:hypothetical protein